MAAEVAHVLATHLQLHHNWGSGTESQHRDQSQTKPSCPFCQGNPQLPEHEHRQRVSQASAQAKGGSGTPSTRKTGPQQLHVKLSLFLS